MPARCTTQPAPPKRGRQSFGVVVVDRARRNRRRGGRSAMACADRTQATTWMSPRAARCRSRILPTPLLAPVIAMFTCLHSLSIRSLDCKQQVERASPQPSAAETCPIPWAVSRRAEGGVVGSFADTCSFLTLAAQARSSTASSFTLVKTTGYIFPLRRRRPCSFSPTCRPQNLRSQLPQLRKSSPSGVAMQLRFTAWGMGPA